MNSSLFCTAAFAAWTIATSSGFAGQMISAGKKTMVEPCPPDPRWLVNLNSSHTFESDFERGHNARGDSWFNQFEIEHRFALEGLQWPNVECGFWYLRLGAGYARWDFDHEGGLPLPNHLQSISGTIALEYLVRGETGILLETEPGVYFEDEIGGDSFDSPTKLAVAFRLSERFVAVGGVSYTGLRSIQFLPIIGFVWTISDQWKVYAIPPEPRIIYSPSDNWKFWLSAELAGGSYRTDSREVPRKPSLNNAVLTYSEWRAGAGLSYLMKGCEIELGAGYAFERKFDYHRAEEGFKTDEGAPYVKVAIKSTF
jgi:Domain of unknown function (DUF6268)